MLCQFTVRNFRCFRDEVTLDMQASSITENEDSLIVGADGERLLPLAVIYGPNGAGKSTVLHALYSLRSKIMRPVWAIKHDNKTSDDPSIHVPIEPFRFSKESAHAPTEYELFFRTRTTEYQYRIAVSRNKVISESLSQKKILGSRYSTVFTRNGANTVLKGSLKGYNVSGLSDELALLSYLIITHSRNELVKDIYEWFARRIIIKNYGNPNTEARVPVSKAQKPLILSMLRELDIDITNYRVEEIRGDEAAGKRLKVYTTHTVGGEDFVLKLDDESSGTIKIFGLLPYLADSIATGTTLAIDELDAKLHPALLQHIIGLYNDPQKNKKGAQLIFTSHDLTTMNSAYFRRDEIWFVAKSGEQAAKLYSLAEFKTRKDARFDKQYLEGRYGADPYLQRIVNWEEL